MDLRSRYRTLTVSATCSVRRTLYRCPTSTSFSDVQESEQRPVAQQTFWVFQTPAICSGDQYCWMVCRMNVCSFDQGVILVWVSVLIKERLTLRWSRASCALYVQFVAYFLISLEMVAFERESLRAMYLWERFSPKRTWIVWQSSYVKCGI